MALAVNTILVSQVLYDAVDLSTAERRVASSAGFFAGARLGAMLAYFVEQGL